MVLPFDHTHDFNPCSFKVQVWSSLIWGMGGTKGCESIIHDHERNLWVTIVWWVDVLYSDWGDFRRQRAVNISSSSGSYLEFLHIRVTSDA